MSIPFDWVDIASYVAKAGYYEITPRDLQRVFAHAPTDTVNFDCIRKTVEDKYTWTMNDNEHEQDYEDLDIQTTYANYTFIAYREKVTSHSYATAHEDFNFGLETCGLCHNFQWFACSAASRMCYTGHFEVA